MATPDTYLLGDGPAPNETARLDFQHSWFRKLTRNLLPKPISDYLSTVPSPKIADIGTGTGIWLVDLWSQLPPTSVLHGFDIDTAKFPSPDRLPANVKLQQANTLKPFAEERLGAYDLVHVRLLMYGLKKDEWEIVARNLLTLLKPGGWILWEETGYISWVSLPPSRALSEILDYDIRFAQQVGRDITHPARLLEHVENAGFVECVEKDHADYEVFASDAAKKVYVMVLVQAMKGIITRGGLPGLSTEEDIKRLQEAAEADLYSGKYLYGMQMRWVWGKKA
ncbi:hypothetical protein jhhlp_004462 [Lomentospora prolificans]|uniref:Methyltransferase domain-containing protein n=1 Tax=Lomentospora prolificans TaxID=41688 RepID=A0A2N3NBM6_9PEZI|nr:hypothetical protein jhhlp_004462 [Lomentospora prolificans]